MQTLYKHFESQGLHVLGFPCNQFLGQEPGKAAEVQAAMKRKFSIGEHFKIMEKVNVNGKKTPDFYRYLKAAAPGPLGIKVRVVRERNSEEASGYSTANHFSP